MKKINNKGQEGFTLIEILMTVLIIVILALVGITQFNNFAADAKNATTKSNLAILRNSIGTMNALERVRCAKTSVLFPDVATIQKNDITGCYMNGTSPTPSSATAACYPVTLVDPRTGAAYGTDCSVAFATNGNYLTLIPQVDHPYVQNGIPNNPWTGPTATTAANNVTADIAPVANEINCANAPVSVFGTNAAIATQCGVAGGTTAFTGTTLTEAGWCYCQQTGQIWANTANNDGKAVGTGNESNF